MCYQHASDLQSDLQRLKRDLDSGRVRSGNVAEPSKRSATSYSLAVLPFTNVTGEPETEFLSDGITESLINSLSQLPKLRVAPRSLVFRYKGKGVEPETVGRDLNARTVLTGRVFQRADVLNIRTELVDTAKVVQLWGQQYTRKIADIFEVQEEIASEISEKLRLKLTSQEKKRLGKRFTENTEAYRLYLKGRYHLDKRTTEGFNRAIDYFGQAIEKDPSYALAYAGMADSYTFLGMTIFGAMSPRDAMPKAKAAAERALKIDDQLAEAHLALAMVKVFYDWEWSGAERDFKRAIELNVNNSNAHHQYGVAYLMSMGRFDEALAKMRRAQELDPLSLPIDSNLGWVLYQARQYDQAIEQGRKTIHMDPNFFLGHSRLALALALKGVYEEAIAEFQKAITLSAGAPYWIAGLGYTYGLCGKKEQAQKLIDELDELSRQRYVSPFYMAMIYSGLREIDQALRWLDKAFDERAGWLILLKVEPMFDPLRSDPRFADLVRRIGLPP